MDIEKEVAISVLSLTKEGPISQEIIKKDAKVSSQIGEKLLRKLQNDGLIYLEKSFVGADGLQRLKLAVHALELGGDLQRVASFLQWQEFEGMAAIAFEHNNYEVQRNLRFKHSGRKWEIDIIGCRRPLIICADCKHWRHGLRPSELKKVVEEQVERTSALSESLPALAAKTKFASWTEAKLFPTVLTLAVSQAKFYDNVPIVPILQLQDFLERLPAYAETLRSIRKT
jgi:hypothetical protein